MKVKAAYIILLLSALGCSKDHLTPFSEYKKIAGIWVPYEILYNDGSINNGPFTANSIFGGYDESVQLNSDKTYFPLVWHSADEYIIDTGEGGNFQYIADKKKIILTEGSWDMEFEVAKYEEDELWLSNLTVLYKLKRELKQ